MNRLGWAVRRTYEIDGHVFGVRTNDAAWLDAATGGLEPRDEEAEPYLSAWLAEPTRGATRRYSLLYRGCDVLLRTLDRAALALRLGAELETFALRRRDDALYLDACVVERRGRRALVPATIVPYLRPAGGRVDREPTRVFDTATVGVTRGGALFAPAAALGLGPQPQELPGAVDALCIFHDDPNYPAILPLPRALAVHALARQARNLGAARVEGLRALAALAAATPSYLLQRAGPRRALELLNAVLDGELGPGA